MARACFLLFSRSGGSERGDGRGSRSEWSFFLIWLPGENKIKILEVYSVVNILVLCGGLSNERDVSISSGTGVALALRERGHHVALADLFLGFPGALSSPLEAFQSGAGLGKALIGETSPNLEEIRAKRPNWKERVGPNILPL